MNATEPKDKVMSMKDAINKRPELLATPTFESWAREHQEDFGE